MTLKTPKYISRILLSVSIFVAVVVGFTVYANLRVESAAKDKLYSDIKDLPHNKVALLLGTNPLNRLGRPNTYFTDRINTAAELYHSGKVDFIIASGDNHTKLYDEPAAMRDSLIAHGVPANRIILDFAGFRTWDSVVRSKEIFGCDSMTIISQADHDARALYLADANGIDAVAIVAPLRAGRWVRTRLAVREWLARDKMMLDILLGKQPHFLGEKIIIPEVNSRKSYSSVPGMTMKIIQPDIIVSQVDSLVVELINTRKDDAVTGEWFRIERLCEDSVWRKLPFDHRYGDVLFNDLGYGVSADRPLRMTIKPWFYEKPWKPGTYRIAKKFHYPPVPILKSDTVYVEFEVR
ncbi:MAG: YdcF family protein [Muribaculaceae bacterium]|nr:YdcF family protein [Muribaculaceae bacterium]